MLPVFPFSCLVFMSCLSLIVVKPLSSYSRQKEGELKRRVSEFRLKEEQTKERLQYSEQEGATAITIIEDQVRQESNIMPYYLCARCVYVVRTLCVCVWACTYLYICHPNITPPVTLPPLCPRTLI